jgi:hypothetical protein
MLAVVQTFKLRVQPGPEGLRQFKEQVRSLLGEYSPEVAVQAEYLPTAVLVQLPLNCSVSSPSCCKQALTSTTALMSALSAR